MDTYTVAIIKKIKKLFKEFVTINYIMKYHRYRYSFNKWINRKRKWDPLEHEKKVRNIMTYYHHCIMKIRRGGLSINVG